MPEVAVEVPERVARAVRDTVVHLYRATTEALHLSLAAGDETGDALEEIQHHRERLKRMDALLEQLGWPGEGTPQPVSAGKGSRLRLSASHDLLRDALHGALIDAGERLAVACEASWRDEASATSVSEAASDVIELDRLLREIDAKEGR